MVRCPNGSKRNKSSGKCETKKKSTRQKRCRNGMRRSRKTKICEWKVERQLSTDRLSSKEIMEMLNENGYKESDPKYSILYNKLQKLQFIKKYKSCFGDKLPTLLDQGIDKLQCYRKYHSDF